MDSYSSVMVCASMICIYIAFTKYPSRYLYLTFSESDFYRIRNSLFAYVTETNRIRIYIRALSVSESESEYNMKTNMISTISVRIRSVFIPNEVQRRVQGVYLCPTTIKRLKVRLSRRTTIVLFHRSALVRPHTRARCVPKNVTPGGPSWISIPQNAT